MIVPGVLLCSMSIVGEELLRDILAIKECEKGQESCFVLSRWYVEQLVVGQFPSCENVKRCFFLALSQASSIPSQLWSMP